MVGCARADLARALGDFMHRQQSRFAALANPVPSAVPPPPARANAVRPPATTPESSPAATAAMPTAAAAMPTAAATVPTATAAVPTAAAMPTAVATPAMPTAAAMAAAAMSGESDSGKGQCRGQCRDKCQFTKLHRHSSSSPAAWKASNQSGGSKAPRVSPSKTGVAASCIQTPHVLTTQQLTSAESDVHPPFRKNDLLRGQEPTALFFAAPGFRPPRREADHRLARQARGAYGAAGPCPVRPETVTLTDSLSVTA